MNIEMQILKIDDIKPGWPDNAGDKQLTVCLGMKKSQMKAAFGEFLAHITPADLADWITDFAPEYVLKDES
jgi:hypothetical protein